MDNNELIKNLRIKSNMIFWGEKIAFGSECELMDEAAKVIEQLQAAQQQSAGEIAELEKKLATWIMRSDKTWHEKKFLDEIDELKADNERLREALELIHSDKLSSRFDCQMEAKQSLCKKVSSSLINHNNQIIDKCISKLENGEYQYIQEAIADLEKLKHD